MGKHGKHKHRGLRMPVLRRGGNPCEERETMGPVRCPEFDVMMSMNKSCDITKR